MARPGAMWESELEGYYDWVATMSFTTFATMMIERAHREAQTEADALVTPSDAPTRPATPR